MSRNSRIEWTDDSWNPIRARNRENGRVGWFCIHKSAGCVNCYAEPFNRRLGTGVDYKAQNQKLVEIFIDETMLTAPLRWRKPRTIFVCSMTDLFGEFVTDEMIAKVWAVMTLCPQHTFIVLTKRSDRMREWVRRSCSDVLANIISLKSATPSLRHPTEGPWPLPNVWLGVSAEAEPEARERVGHLMETPAAIRLVSMEPLLGPINVIGDLDPGRCGCDVCATTSVRCTASRHPVDWVIVGGESGPKARVMEARWARDLRAQCQRAGVAFFFKQWGEFAPVDQLGRESMMRVGKKAAGRLLDGVEHNARPLTTAEGAAA